MPLKPSQNELRFAQGLLRALHGNVNNLYLLLAIVAWIRKEGTGFKYWNPLNIRNSKFASGHWRGSVGAFAIFKDMSTAIRATAYFLTSNKGVGYELIVASAQLDVAKTVSAEQQQAIDFLNAIALSRWSSDHYGTTKHPETLTYAELTAKNALIKIWSSLLGLKFTLPAAPRAKAKPKLPLQPQGLSHIIPQRDYIDGYRTRGFLNARVKDIPLAPAGSYDVLK